MKKISAFLLSAFLIVSISVGAMAARPEISSVTIEGGRVNVTGTNTSGKPMTIEVLQAGKAWTDVATAEDINILQYLYYFNQTDSFGANGSFDFTIIDWAEEQKPEIRVYSGGEYSYYSSTINNEFCNATSSENLKGVIINYPFLNGEITKIFTKLELDESEKNEFWEKLFNYKNSIKDSINSDGNVIDKIIAAAPEIALLARVGITPTEDLKNTKMPEVLAKFEEYGIMDSDSWSIYKNENEFDGEDYLTDTQERELYNLLKEKAKAKPNPNPLHRAAEAECYSAEEFVEYFNDAVVLTACQKGSSDYLVRNIIEKSDVLENEDTGDFSSLSAADKLTVAGVINDAQIRCTTISELAKKISDNAETYTGDDDDDDDGYTPPTGGGGGGGGGKTYAVEKVPEKEETQSKGEFTDLESHKWAEEAIYALQEKGIVQGTGENTFEPARAVTREEFVKMLVLSADIFDENATVAFEDSAQGAWYVPYVGSAYNAKLINGITEDIFGIGRVITREQLAVMIYRALDSQHALQSVNTNGAFSDIDMVSDFAVDAVNYMKSSGLMNGMGDGSFAPHENVNRAQAAKVIYELLQRL